MSKGNAIPFDTRVLKQLDDLMEATQKMELMMIKLPSPSWRWWTLVLLNGGILISVALLTNFWRITQ